MMKAEKINVLKDNPGWKFPDYPKVSVLTPCFNGEKFIDAYMNSILNQTYKNIELIIVNDGSTDHSEDAVLKYKTRLADAGLVFQYIKKPNGGQPSAINAGLSAITGEYMTWIDIDDLSHKDSIEKKMRYFKQYPDLDLLISKCAAYQMPDLAKPLWYGWEKAPKSKDELIRKILLGTDYTYVPGCFMVKMSFYNRINPQKSIYDLCGTWAGPQIQLQLPMIYYGVVGYASECLFDYYIHESNHHNSYKTEEEVLKLIRVVEDIYRHTLDRMNLTENDNIIYTRYYRQNIYRRQLNYAFKYKDKNMGKKAIKELASVRGITFKDLLKAWLIP